MFKVKLDKGLLKTIEEVGFENHTKTEKKTISQIKIDIPTYKANELPENLISIPITKPGSRDLK